MDASNKPWRRKLCGNFGPSFVRLCLAAPWRCPRRRATLAADKPATQQQDSQAQATCEGRAPARAAARKFPQRHNPKLNPRKRARGNITKKAQKPSRDLTLAIRPQNDLIVEDNKHGYSSRPMFDIR